MSDPLKIVPPEPHPDTIKYLEELLQRAKSGDIQGFGIVIRSARGTTANGWTNIGANCMSIIGELEAMKLDVINANVEQRYDCQGEVIDV